MDPTKDNRVPIPRFFPGQRWVNVALRGLHLLGVAGMGAAFLLPGRIDSAWHPYLLVTLSTGIAMSALDAWSDRMWLDQLSGQTMVAKLALLGIIPLWPAAGPVIFAAVILLSALISHAPARIRHYSVRQRRSIVRQGHHRRPADTV